MSSAQVATMERSTEGTSRKATIAYWVFTLWISLTAVAAGVTNILHMQPYFGELLHLGYPAYFGTMLGVWKVLGAVAMLAPRYPLIKEWAFAGMFIDYSSAVVSYLAVGGGAASLAGPIIAIGALVGSWYLRPRSRRLV